MERHFALHRIRTAAAAALLVAGCTKHSDDLDQRVVSLERENSDGIVLIAIDLSGSFADFMTRDGKAYEFILRVADGYFRNSIGTNNRIVIAQLSATDRALLWDGTPVQLRQDFPNADRLRDYLFAKSHPAGSRIHDGVSETLEYAVSDLGVAGGKTRAAVLVLSDFDDNAPNPEKSERRLVDSLQAFGRTGGVVGFYFLDHPRVAVWRRHLQASGVKQWACESGIVAYPPLPSFE